MTAYTCSICHNSKKQQRIFWPVSSIIYHHICKDEEIADKTDQGSLFVHVLRLI